MTNEERQRILEILAYNYAEICKANAVYHDNNYNWKRAEQMLELELRINEEQYILHLLDKESEDEQKV